MIKVHGDVYSAALWATISWEQMVPKIVFCFMFFFFCNYVTIVLISLMKKFTIWKKYNDILHIELFFFWYYMFQLFSSWLCRETFSIGSHHYRGQLPPKELVKRNMLGKGGLIGLLGWISTSKKKNGHSGFVISSYFSF